MPNEVDPSELINADAAAVMLRIRPQTLAVWRSMDKGPPWYRIGGKVYYHPREIKTWLAGQRRGNE